MRLIDADEVVKTLLYTPDVEEIFLDLAQKRGLDYLHNVEESDVVDFARDIVKAAIGVIETSPTVDAEPIRHGEWIYTDYCVWVCSECRENPTRGLGFVQAEEHLYEYCPRCGAKMDRGGMSGND